MDSVKKMIKDIFFSATVYTSFEYGNQISNQYVLLQQKYDYIKTIGIRVKFGLTRLNNDTNEHKNMILVICF